MQQNASRGRQWECFGIVVKILCIVVKNPCRCIVGRNQKYLSLYRLGLLPCPLASGLLAWQQKGGEIFFARAQPLFLAASPFATRVCSHSTISHTASSLERRTYPVDKLSCHCKYGLELRSCKWKTCSCSCIELLCDKQVECYLLDHSLSLQVGDRSH